MSDRPLFIYAAIYADHEDALADYNSLLDLHADKLVGTYDVAVIRKAADGKVHVEKREKPTQHGAWGGIAVGALVGYDFGPLAVQVWFDQTVECANAVCGLDVWGRFSFKIWGPETPKPVTSKN